MAKQTHKAPGKRLTGLASDIYFGERFGYAGEVSREFARSGSDDLTVVMTALSVQGDLVADQYQGPVWLSNPVAIREKLERHNSLPFGGIFDGEQATVDRIAHTQYGALVIHTTTIAFYPHDFNTY